MFRSSEPLVDKIEYRTVFGIHVRLLADLIALISIFVQSYLGSKVAGDEDFWWAIAGPLLSIVAAVLVIAADRYEKAWLYLPFLIAKVITVIGVCLATLFTALCLIADEDFWQEVVEMEKTKSDWYTMVPFIVILACILAIVAELYCLSVVTRARKYMIHEVEGRSLPTTAPASPESKKLTDSA
uniref:MARVEL domain-containing protein n=1 Tax=Panagrellus redivivus TaxID=6233 RepID=A0A7E4VV11_PANRE